MIQERLLSVSSACKRLTELSFPRRFPIVQFPNLPLIVALIAGAAGMFLDGTAHSYAAAVSYLALTIWAYEELTHGVNWFRRILGLVFVILLIVRVARAWHA
jgi:TRAP-type C4-dicarboxylate transport system permease large subunit